MNTEEQPIPSFRVDDGIINLSDKLSDKIPIQHLEMIKVIQKLNIIDRNQIIIPAAKSLREVAIMNNWTHRLIEQSIYLHYRNIFKKPWTISFYVAHKKLYSEIFHKELNAKFLLNYYTNPNGDLLLRY
jgi:hypothetical protein